MKKNHKKCRDCKRLIACDENDKQDIIDSLATVTSMSNKEGLCAQCYRKRCSDRREEKR